MAGRSPVTRGYLYILASGALWGTTGIFARFLYQADIHSHQIAFLRNLLALAAFSILLLLGRRSEFRVELRYLPLLAAVGLTNVTAFSLFYFYTIEKSTITQAVFLMYIGPVFAVLMGRLFLGEALVGAKLAALALSIGGLVLLTGMYNPMQLSMPREAVLAGFASAITYGFARTTGKLALRRCSHWSTTFYSFAFGVLFLFILTKPHNFFLSVSGSSWLLIGVMALVPGVGAYLCFFKGLQLVESSRASILGTLEPVVAAALALAVFGEVLSPLGIGGAALILLGAVLVQRK